MLAGWEHPWRLKQKSYFSQALPGSTQTAPSSEVGPPKERDVTVPQPTAESNGGASSGNDVSWLCSLEFPLVSPSSQGLATAWCPDVSKRKKNLWLLQSRALQSEEMPELRYPLPTESMNISMMPIHLYTHMYVYIYLYTITYHFLHHPRVTDWCSGIGRRKKSWLAPVASHLLCRGHCIAVRLSIYCHLDQKALNYS